MRRWVALGGGWKEETRAERFVLSWGLCQVMFAELFKSVVDLCARLVVKDGGSEYASSSCFVINECRGVDV